MLGTHPTLSTKLHTVIQDNPHLLGRNLRLEENDGKVVVRGTVGSYYQKQMAQEALRKVVGVQEIENELEVNWL